MMISSSLVVSVLVKPVCPVIVPVIGSVISEVYMDIDRAADRVRGSSGEVGVAVVGVVNELVVYGIL